MLVYPIVYLHGHVYLTSLSFDYVFRLILGYQKIQVFLNIFVLDKETLVHKVVQELHSLLQLYIAFTLINLCVAPIDLLEQFPAQYFVEGDLHSLDLCLLLENSHLHLFFLFNQFFLLLNLLLRELNISLEIKLDLILFSVKYDLL